MTDEKDSQPREPLTEATPMEGVTRAHSQAQSVQTSTHTARKVFNKEQENNATDTTEGDGRENDGQKKRTRDAAESARNDTNYDSKSDAKGVLNENADESEKGNIEEAFNENRKKETSKDIKESTKGGPEEHFEGGGEGVVDDTKLDKRVEMEESTREPAKMDPTSGKKVSEERSAKENIAVDFEGGTEAKRMEVEAREDTRNKSQIDVSKNLKGGIKVDAGKSAEENMIESAEVGEKNESQVKKENAFARKNIKDIGRADAGVVEEGVEGNEKKSAKWSAKKGAKVDERDGSKENVLEDKKNAFEDNANDRINEGPQDVVKEDAGQVLGQSEVNDSRHDSKDTGTKAAKADTPKAATHAMNETATETSLTAKAEAAPDSTVGSAPMTTRNEAEKAAPGSIAENESKQGKPSSEDQEDSVDGDDEAQDEPGLPISDVSAQKRTRRASARTLRSRGQKKEVDPSALQAEKKDRERITAKLKELMADLPRPVKTDEGLKLEIGEAVFVEENQLDSMKRKRMIDKELKPIEKLTFADVSSFNRDQLRCYCYIYGCPRRKKSEMEIDMALFVCLWNDGNPDYVLAEYVPKNSKEPVPEDVAVITISAAKAAVKEAEEAAAAAVATAAAAEAAAAVEVAAKKSAPENIELNQTELPKRPSRRSGANRSTDLFKETADGSTSPSKHHVRQAGKSPVTAAGKTTAGTLNPISSKRPSMRPEILGSAPPSTSRRSRSASRPIAAARTSIPIAVAPVIQNVAIQNHTQAQIQGGSARNAGGTGKSLKSNIPVQQLPKGYGTSFKQKVHARVAGEKFKAAYDGAGPATVTVVENAAAYFEGKDTSEVIRDQAKSYSRYQFNVDLLTEIFDGPPSDEEGDAEMEIDKAEDDVKNVMREVTKRMRSPVSPEDTAIELELWEESFRRLENETRETERANMRLFQRLERAETEEEVEAVKQEFERYHKVRLSGAPPPLVRRKLDKSLPPVLMPDNECRILRFKVS